ncbi:MAG: inositol monophosphatase family protein, partial [Candidatus Hodarchaeota archaeon]
SEETIRNILGRSFPDYSIMGEESGYSGGRSNYMWVIDPLDGTTNYMMRNPYFSISISLIYQKEPILGVVYYPSVKELLIFTTPFCGGVRCWFLSRPSANTFE